MLEGERVPFVSSVCAARPWLHAAGAVHVHTLFEKSLHSKEESKEEFNLYCVFECAFPTVICNGLL